MITLLRNLHKFPRVWKATNKIEKAWDLFAQGQFKEAEFEFEKGEHFLKMLPYEFKIIKGQIKFALSKYEESNRIYRSAWFEINEDKQLSLADKLYLKEYIFSALKIYDDYLGFDLKDIEYISPSDVPLKSVSKVWKRRFPSRDHPDWHKYGC